MNAMRVKAGIVALYAPKVTFIAFFAAGRASFSGM
jgi:hypothetical protein